MRRFGSRIVVSLVGFLVCPTVFAQVTARMSLSSSGVQGNWESGVSAISADGRYVAFESIATNLVTGDTNNAVDVFVRDRLSGITERVSVATDGTQGNSDSYSPSVSADGRFIAFVSNASNLVPHDTNGWGDTFVRDRLTGTTERVSVDSAGLQADGSSDVIRGVSISADGRYVAFRCGASNLVPGDTNDCPDIFVRDRLSTTTERVSIATEGTEADAESHSPAISPDGRFVAFTSQASNLVPGDTNGMRDIFIHDRQSGATERVSVATDGTQGNFWSEDPAISADGRFVAFWSLAYNLVPNDTNGIYDIFMRDRQSLTTELVSIAPNGEVGNSASRLPSVSADGRYVAFSSGSSNLVQGDTNITVDVFVRDRLYGTTERVSVSSDGSEGNSGSDLASMSADGNRIAFRSLASNLVPGDTNATYDVFLRDRSASAFTSLCDSSLDGVIGCPCSNPSSESGRGCDNSSSTGGASLSAAGVAYLSTDTLSFITSGENPSALSIVMQGNSVIPNGVVYGQGVRCLGGPLIRRLFVKQAVAGSISAPEFGAGDPTVSSRSAAKGDVIQPGQSRWYLVYYRDPNVLGGCPATSTFNATQTGRVDWSP